MANNITSATPQQSPASVTPVSNLDLMQKFAEGTQTLDEIQLLTSSRVTDQLKVFLIAQARNELKHIIDLTIFLDKLETNLIAKVTKEMANDTLSLKQYSEVIETIKVLLDRSNAIISEVLKDDSLTTITSTTVYQPSGGSMQTMSVTSRLQDAQSRERVRNVLQEILKKTEKYETPITAEYQDTTDEERGKKND